MQFLVFHISTHDIYANSFALTLRCQSQGLDCPSHGHRQLCHSQNSATHVMTIYIMSTIIIHYFDYLTVMFADLRVYFKLLPHNGIKIQTPILNANTQFKCPSFFSFYCAHNRPSLLVLLIPVLILLFLPPLFLGLVL